MAKTALTEFCEELERQMTIETFQFYKELKAKALEKEKQQIINAAKWMPKPYHFIEFIPELAEQYYLETFNYD